jgi:AcrR family transcriptional regulator
MGERQLPKAMDASTEEKIKSAARIIFTKKGYAAARTRDIAEESGINLALLNYYFRSKEKLFDLIMLESLQDFMHSIARVFNNEESSLEDKLHTLVTHYIDMLMSQPDLPLFVLSELKRNPGDLMIKLNLKENLMHSVFLRQIKEAMTTGKIQRMHPLHFIMNVMGLIVFPFVASPLIKSIGDLSQEEFITMMEQRKNLIPSWMATMMIVK